MYQILIDIFNNVYALIGSAIIILSIVAFIWIYVCQGKNGVQTIIRLLGISIVLLAGMAGLAILLPQDSLFHTNPTYPLGTVITTFRGHTSMVDSLAWSPDGTRIVSIGSFGDMQSWDAKTGKHLVIYTKEANQVNTITWSPDGKWIAEGEYGGLAHIWNANTGQLLLTYDCHCYSILQLVWSPDSARIASLSEDTGLHIWSIFTGRDLESYAEFAGLSSTSIAGWYSDGLYVVTSDNGGTQQIWNVTTKREIFEYHESLKGYSSELVLSPDRKHVAVSILEGSIQLWDVATKKQDVTIRLVRAHNLSWSSDSNYLAASLNDTTQIWDARTGNDFFIYTSRTHAYSGPYKWSPDGTKIASGNSDSSVVVWQAGEGNASPAFKLEFPSLPPLVFISLVVIILIVFGTGFFNVRSLKTGSTRVWLPMGVSVLALISIMSITLAVQAMSPPATAFHQPTLNPPLPKGTSFFSYRGDTVAWSPDGMRLAIGLPNGSAYVWDAATGNRLLSHRSYRNTINTVAWSPDGRAIAAGYDNGYVEIWDAKAGNTLFTYKEHRGKVVSVAWSSDGKRIASLSSPDNTILIWQAPVTVQGQLSLPWELSVVLVSTFGLFLIAVILTMFLYSRKAQNAQQKRLISAGLALVSLFGLIGLVIFLPSIVSTVFSSTHRTTTGTTLVRHKGNLMAWSPDSAYIASTNEDGEVHVWSADGGKDLFTYISRTLAVTSLAWSPDQKYIASGTTVGTVQVWNSLNGHTLFTYYLDDLPVTVVSWSPDGKHIASGGKNIQIWDAFTGGKIFFYLDQGVVFKTIAWSPDGTRIASVNSVNAFPVPDSLVKIWQGEERIDSQLVHLQIGKVNITSLPLLTGTTLGLTALLIAGMIWLRKSRYHLWRSLNVIAIILFCLVGMTDLVALAPLIHKPMGVSGSTMDPIYEYSASGGVWSPDGKLFATYVLGTDVVHIWRDQEGDLDLTYRGYSGSVTTLAWSRDGTRIASGYSDGTIQIWDVITGHNLFQYHGQTVYITNLSWSPDDSYIVSTSGDNAVQALMVSTGNLRFQGKLGDDVCGDMDWSPDGSRVLFACKTVQIWDASTGKELLAVPSNIGGVRAAVWSPNSKMFVMASDDDGTIQERDASTGNILLTFPNITDQIISRVSAIAWSHNGKYIASRDYFNGGIQLWDAITGRHLRSLSSPSYSTGPLAWSPDDKYLALSGSIWQIWQA